MNAFLHSESFFLWPLMARRHVFVRLRYACNVSSDLLNYELSGMSFKAIYVHDQKQRLNTHGEEEHKLPLISRDADIGMTR